MSPSNRREFLKRTTGALGVAGAVTAGGVLATEHASSLAVTEARTATGDDLPPLREESTDDNWLEYRAGPGNTGSLPAAPGVDPAVHDCSCIYDGTFHGEPAIVDGTLYVGERQTGGRVHALDAREGSVQWTSDDVGALAAPAVGYGKVFAANLGDQPGVVALDADRGHFEWRFEFDHRPTVPTVAYETVFVVGDETLYALEHEEAVVRWERDLDVTFDAYRTPPAVGDGRLYVLTDGPMYALDPRTGEELWRTEDEDFLTDAGELGATSDRVVARTTDGALAIHDAETGDRVSEISGSRSALDDAGVVRRVDGVLAAHRFDGGDGWEFQAEELSRPAIAGDRVYVYVGADGGSAREHHLVALDRDDGGVVWTCEVDEVDRARHVDLAVTGDAVYALGNEEIHAIHGAGGDDHDH